MTESTFVKHPDAGEASVFMGDPRLAKVDDIDTWWNGMLSSVEPPSARPYLYGADAGLCARKNVLHAHNTWAPFDKTAASTAYMALGDALENMLADALRRWGKLVAQNMRLVEMPELKISGKMDLICSDHDEKLRLVEVKSCGLLPAEPKMGHLAQVEMYAAVSGFDRVWLTYVSRNVRNGYGHSVDMKTFEVDITSDVIMGRLKIAAMSMLAAKHKRLPPKSPHFRKSKECSYCPFLAFCWDDEHTGLRPMSDATFAKFDAAATHLAERLVLGRSHRYLRTLSQCMSVVPKGTIKGIVRKELKNASFPGGEISF